MPAMTATIKHQVLLDVGQVVGHDLGTGDGGDVKGGGGEFLFLVGGHGGVGAGELDGAVGDALDAAAGADGLVVDFHVGVWPRCKC